MPRVSNYRPHQAWHFWYHCVCNTYGTWLPGDPRGFRTKDHREHVAGDYKNPPPEGLYDKRHASSTHQMTQDAVLLSTNAKQLVLDTMLEAFRVHQIDIAALVVTPMHVHVLARFPSDLLDVLNAPAPRSPGTAVRRSPGIAIPGLPRTTSKDDPPRHYMGIAKKESARALSKAQLKPAGKTWAFRGKIVPVKSEQHFHHLRDVYLPDHQHQQGLVHVDTRITP